MKLFLQRFVFYAQNCFILKLLYGQAQDSPGDGDDTLNLTKNSEEKFGPFGGMPVASGNQLAEIIFCFKQNGTEKMFPLALFSQASTSALPATFCR